MLEIAALANDSGVAVSPHCWNSMTVAAAAMLHVCAAIPNSEMAEIYPEYVTNCSRFASYRFNLKDSYVFLFDRSGLGVEIDIENLSAISTEHQQCNLD